eukprot:58298_1
MGESGDYGSHWKGYSHSHETRQNEQLLLFSCITGDLKTVRQLVQENVDYTVRNEEGETPLSLSAFRGSVILVRGFINYMKSKNSADFYREISIALHAAVRSGSIDCIDLLSQHATRQALATSLIFAAMMGDLRIFEHMCSIIGDDLGSVHIQTGRSPLIIATMNGHTDLVQFCLNHPTLNDIQLLDKHGMSALNWALRRGRTDVGLLLRRVYRAQVAEACRALPARVLSEITDFLTFDAAEQLDGSISSSGSDE